MHWAQAVAALEHCEAVDPQRRLEALLALGEAHRLAGDRAATRVGVRRARSRRRARSGRPLERARAAIGFCDLSEWAPADEAARAALEAALAELPGGGRRAARARCSPALAYLDGSRAPERAQPAAREAVSSRARRRRRARRCGGALHAASSLLAGPDHLAERAALAREARRAARAAAAATRRVIRCSTAAATA